MVLLEFKREMFMKTSYKSHLLLSEERQRRRKDKPTVFKTTNRSEQVQEKRVTGVFREKM